VKAISDHDQPCCRSSTRERMVFARATPDLPVGGRSAALL
jgi:hypothetical protein